MWAILSRATGLSLKQSYALIKPKFFSTTHSVLARLSIDPAERRQQLDELKLRRRTDPEWHKRALAACESHRRRNASELSAYNSQYFRSSWRRSTSDPAFLLARRLSDWTRLNVWVREELPWKTHRPVLHKTPTPHRCEFCDLKRPRGSKLVWQRIAQPDLYSCHRCYVRQGAEICMPTGYEDICDIRELAARRKQLEQPKSS